jgi:hypothetical protein
MTNRIHAAGECDATDDAQGTEAGKIKKMFL